MKPLGRNRIEFTTFWVIATLWLPLLISIWSKLIVRPLMPTPFETPIEIQILGVLSGLGVLIAGLSQSILLVGRTDRPWLWIVAGIAAVLIQNAVTFALFELAMALPAGYRHLLYYPLGILAVGFAMSIAQAVVLRHWHLNGMTWFLVSFGAVLLGLAALVIVDRIFKVDATESATVVGIIPGVMKMLALWMTYGVITGSALWHRLNSDGKAISSPA